MFVVLRVSCVEMLGMQDILLQHMTCRQPVRISQLCWPQFSMSCSRKLPRILMFVQIIEMVNAIRQVQVLFAMIFYTTFPILKCYNMNHLYFPLCTGCSVLCQCCYLVVRFWRLNHAPIVLRCPAPLGPSHRTCELDANINTNTTLSPGWSQPRLQPGPDHR